MGTSEWRAIAEVSNVRWCHLLSDKYAFIIRVKIILVSEIEAWATQQSLPIAPQFIQVLKNKLKKIKFSQVMHLVFWCVEKNIKQYTLFRTF